MICVGVMPHEANGWVPKSRRRKSGLVTSLDGSRASGVSVPQRMEITDPMFRLTGTKMMSQVAIEEHQANAITVVTIVDSLRLTGCDG